MMITDYGLRIPDEGLQTIKSIPTPFPLGEGWREGRGQVANLIIGQFVNEPMGVSQNSKVKIQTTAPVGNWGTVFEF